MRRLIFIDLDCTLIDSEKRYEDEKQMAERFGIKRDVYVWAVNELYRRHGTYKYSFALLCEILRERTPRANKNFEGELSRLLGRNYFFSDAPQFLSRFNCEELILLTSGTPDFQSRKIDVHGLNEVVKATFITDNKPIIIGREKRGSALNFFIDDAPREIEAVKRIHPDVVCIQIRTPPSWEMQKHTPLADARLPDLVSAVEYIERKTAPA